MIPRPFIPAALDDYGLSPAQFRVYCHVARRGNCFSSSKTMAKVCRMNQDTVWDALAFLKTSGLIVAKAERGKATLFTIADLPENRGHPSVSGDPQNPVTDSDGCPSDSADTHRKTGDTDLPENRGHKGNPLEGSPGEGVGSPPGEIGNRVEQARERWKGAFPSRIQRERDRYEKQLASAKGASRDLLKALIKVLDDEMKGGPVPESQSPESDPVVEVPRVRQAEEKIQSSIAAMRAAIDVPPTVK